MQIDWITVAAQIVNFLVLVWLLHRFLYGPVVRAMDRRELRIADRLREADRKREEAEAEAAAYRAKQAELDEQRDDLMSAARQEAQQEKKALEQAAQAEVAQQKQAWLKQVETQQAEFLQDLRDHSTKHFYALARRALADLADARLEEQMVQAFIDRVERLDRATKKKIATECERFDRRILIRSRFELDPAEKRRLTHAIHEQILDGAEVVYEEGAAAGTGLELKAGGQTVSWNLDSYLDDLERRTEEELDALRPAVR
jgi:F-type H+-transporting ATPase subunit b